MKCLNKKMASSIILTGLGVASVGFAGRYLVRQMPTIFTKFNNVAKNLSKITNESLASSKYYKGGFEQKMTRREAALVFGVSPNAPKSKVKDAYKRIMVLNHPDRGGSAYLAAKINEAKDFMDKHS